MNRKIFRSAFFTSMLVLIAAAALIMGVLFEYFGMQLQNELKNEASYISQAVKNEGTAYIDSFENSEKRITLIDKDGTVLADTAADVSGLDNHLYRKEVREAFEKGSGMSVRYSDTLTEKTVYYAQKLEDGRVLRVSATQYTIIRILAGLVYPIIAVIIIALILSMILSSKISKSIIRPINELDLDNPENNETYEELTPLLRRISVQRRQIDKQLRETRNKQEEFRLITENMSEGFLLIDSKTNLLTCNTAALRLLQTDGVQKNDSVLILNRTKGFREAVGKALGGERNENIIGIDDRSYSLIASPVFDNNTVIGAVIVILDVTESVNREKLRCEFTSNVSHELKTPLTSISGFAEMMMEGGISESTVVDFSKSIYDEAQRLISLVGDIIKISELDAKNTDFEKESVDLCELAKSAADRIRPDADKKNIRIYVTDGSIKIIGVRRILEEMIYNLLENAVRYNKDNGKAEVIITETGDKVNLTVKDNGVGIPKADQARVFERFYCVDKSHSKQAGGTGLGLSIVKHGAAYHNASVSLESTVGKGTEITVSFKKTLMGISKNLV